MDAKGERTASGQKRGSDSQTKPKTNMQIQPPACEVLREAQQTTVAFLAPDVWVKLRHGFTKEEEDPLKWLSLGGLEKRAYNKETRDE